MHVDIQKFFFDADMAMKTLADVNGTERQADALAEALGERLKFLVRRAAKGERIRRSVRERFSLKGPMAKMP